MKGDDTMTDEERAGAFAAAVKACDPAALEKFREICGGPLRENAIIYLRTAKLAAHVERNGVWEYQFPEPDHQAVKIWLSTAPKKPRRTN
jgi:hypothetical protein